MKLSRTQFDILVHLLDADMDTLAAEQMSAAEELKNLGLLVV